MLLFFAALVSSKLGICEMCVDKVGTAMEMARKGASLRRVNYTMLKQCEELSGFMRIGCKSYVKKYIPELYKSANTTTMSAHEICVQKGACSSEL